MYVVRDPNDELMKCPFNENHIILRSRIHYHLVKCRRKHLNSTKIQCPYDATEYLEPENFEQHLRECKSKTAVLNVQHSLRDMLETKSHGDLTPTPFHMPVEKLDSSEMWDNDDDISEPAATITASSSRAPDPPGVAALRSHLKKVYGIPAEPIKPMGRGAMLMKLLGK